LLLVLSCLLYPLSRADEGMWLLPLLDELNINEMEKMGLQLDADQIFSLNQSSIKDAIGALDYGSCTAELISADGLILTNHHCGYSEIQSHSTLAHDYLSDGFWAARREDELPNPGKSISFLVSMDDVTDRIDAKLNPEMTQTERTGKIEEISDELIEKATEGTHYEGFVYSFYNGNTYYLVLLETFLDVRLVGAPPSSIGKFGDDTDNWVWPRHTGDFSMFRIYTGPDGKPAEYSPDNLPYHPSHFLPISTAGIKEDDFTMVIGFPGNTERYMTAAEIRERMEITNNIRVQVGDIALSLMKEDMLEDDRIRIQYSDKYAAYSNYWKFSRGENKSLDELGIIEKQEELEARFVDWVSQDTERQTKYGGILYDIKTSIDDRRQYAWPRAYLEEVFLLYKPIEFIDFAAASFPLYLALRGDEDYSADFDEIIASIRDEAIDYFDDYNKATDKKISVALMKHFDENVNPLFHPFFLYDVKKNFDGDYGEYIDYLFKKSIFTDRQRFLKFLDNPKFKKIENDPVFEIARMLFLKYFEIDDLYAEHSAGFQESKRLYMAGIMEMMNGKTFYPDANSTLRLSYGKVSDYYPSDAVQFDYYTTLAGVMEKEDPHNAEFHVSQKLKELYLNKEFGKYGQDSIMPVCFITDNDITGGNSGSPVLNSEGALVGVAFDGNWEAMSADIAYEPDLQKCICVDIRYVLFIIDKFAGAGHLIEEMQIVE